MHIKVILPKIFSLNRKRKRPAETYREAILRTIRRRFPEGLKTASRPRQPVEVQISIEASLESPTEAVVFEIWALKEENEPRIMKAVSDISRIVGNFTKLRPETYLLLSDRLRGKRGH